ncbi:MAG: sugar ABC transporter permease [Clostridiales bacterium]|jgi:raffinose/stachyose/melibiose transport system permease protein|nr:sugar ABC transporter permease [Clostridiales bacterium]
MTKPKSMTFVLYLLPSILLYTFIVFVPIVLAGYYGFFDWSGGVSKTFIGFQNYLGLFSDDEFKKSFVNNIYLTFLCIVGQIGLAFVFAAMLNSKLIKFKPFHRTMTYFPSILSAVVIGFIWNMIYDYNYGFLNTMLTKLGMSQYVQPWLNNEKMALTLVSIPLIWQFVGYYMIILMSSMAAIDPQIFEMAEIDGATGWKKARYITLPMIKNTLIVCVTLCIAGNMKVFDHIYVMTGGGPGDATNVMAMYAYKTSFVSYKMGYGSAMSIGILILSLIVIGSTRYVLTRLSREKE